MDIIFFPEMNTHAFSTELIGLTEEEISAKYFIILIDIWNVTMDPKLRLKALHLECDKKWRNK